MSYPGLPDVRFSDEELFDLAVAWIALTLAFAILLTPIDVGRMDVGVFVVNVALSFVTVGVGFLLHELAHKVVAVHFGQVAEFRANYRMLFVALLFALADFLIAAPGAVYHRGRITLRQNGLISVAGPVTNLALAVVFFPLVFASGLVGAVGHLGVLINLFLAAFNMLPFGPLDGRSVFRWSTPVFLVVFATSAIALAAFLLRFGIGFW